MGDKGLGAFVKSLQRNNGQIISDRAELISDDAKTSYRNRINEIVLAINRMGRERKSALDLSPADANSLVLAADFNANEFVNKDMEFAIKIRNKEIELELAKTRYQYLFGEGYNEVLD